MWQPIALRPLFRCPPCSLYTFCSPLSQTSNCQELGGCRKQGWHKLSCQDGVKTANMVPYSMMFSSSMSFKTENRNPHAKNFPVLDGNIPSLYRHVLEGNARNSEICIQR